MIGLSLGNLWVHLGLDASNYLKNLQLAQSKLIATGKHMETVGRTMTRKVTMPILAVGAASVRSLAKFEEEMANVSTMLDEQTMKYMPAYTSSVKDMSIEFGESTKTITVGLYNILSASVDPAKALDVLSVSLKAAKAGMTDTAVAADVITTILNSYSMSADEAEHVSDILFATVKKGKITFPELASNIGMVASVAATAGLQFEQVGAAISTMTRAGMPAARATTALRSIISGMLKPMDDSKKAAEEFGLELSSNTLKTIGLTGVILKLKDASAEQIATIFPNIRAMTGLAAQVKQVAGQLSDLDFMFNATGKTQEAYDKMTNTLMHSLKQLWRLLVVVSIEIGDTLRPMIERLTQSLIKALKWWRSLGDETKVFVSKIALVTAVIGPSILIIGKMLSSLGFLIMGFTALSTSLKGVMAGFIGLTASMLPIIAVVAAVAVAAYTLRAAWTQGVEAIRNRIEAIGDYLKQLIDGIRNSIIGKFVVWMVNAFYEMFGAIARGWKDFVSDLYASVVSAWDWLKAIKDGVIDVWTAFDFSQAYNKAKNMFNKANKEWAKSFVDNKDVVAAAVNDIEKTVLDGYETSAVYIKAFGEATYEHLGELAAAVKKQVGEDAQALVNIISSKMTKMKAEGLSVLPAEDIAEIKKQLQELNDELGKVASDGAYAFTTLKEHVDEASKFFENIETVGTRAFDTVGDTLTDLAMTGKADFRDMAESILRDFTNMMIKMQMAKGLQSLFPSLVPMDETGTAAALTTAGAEVSAALTAAGAESATAITAAGASASTGLTTGITTAGSSVSVGLTTAAGSASTSLISAGATVSTAITTAGAAAAAAIAAAAAGGALGGGGTGAAFGKAFSHGKIIPMQTGGLITQPTLFPMANNDTILGGEKGDEAIMPLGRDSRGRLGVYSDQSQRPIFKQKIVNIYDKSHLYEAMQTDEGEEIFFNFLGKAGLI